MAFARDNRFARRPIVGHTTAGDGGGAAVIPISCPRNPETRADMRALTLVADRKLELADVAAPAAPAAGEVQVRVKAVGLNHIDLWGYRGMAFAKRKLPLVVGAEAAGVVAAIGADVSSLAIGDPVVMYGALTCGSGKACREGREILSQIVAAL